MDGREDWPQTAHRVPTAVYSTMVGRGVLRAHELASEMTQLITQREVIPGGRYLYAAGRPLHQTQNCLLKRAHDSREGWADHYYEHIMGLSTGAGIGTVYSWISPKGRKLRRSGGVAGGPVNLALGTNEAGRTVRQGGDRRAALWAGLHWWHEDIFQYIAVKNWGPEVRRLKAENFDFPAPLDYTNHSVCLDDAFFAAMAGDRTPMGAIREAARGFMNVAFDDTPACEWASRVYWAVIRNMRETGDPGLSIDVGPNAGECLRNACTEVSSADDSDICNIASINIGRMESIDQFKKAIYQTVAFLIAGSEYSDVPYEKVRRVREKNRRLGLGIMGVHEWLLRRGRQYGPDEELGRWLAEYARATEIAADIADEWGLSRPVKTRAMAPNGTIGIVAETTTCMEPLLTVAYKRRVKKGDETWAQYVVDPVADRLIREGISPDKVETAYSLAETKEGVERRVAFQAWFQQYVDHGISSTINLPAWGSSTNNEEGVQWFGEMLLPYLPKLRGITVYPDLSRGGQPITQVSYQTALKHAGQTVYEQGDVCELTRGGTCGA